MASQKPSDRNVELLEMHGRLLADDPVATYDIAHAVGQDLVRYLRFRFPSLALAQAVTSFTHLTRAMLVNVDPTQCRLRMVEE